MSLLVMTVLSVGLSLADIKIGSASDGVIPVSSVVDLQVGSCSYRGGIIYINLKWTSPRGYTVSRYDIRVAQTAEQINNHFSAARKIDPSLVVHGSLMSSGPGAAEELTTRLPIKAVWQQYVFALKTFDLNDKPSSVSNRAQVSRKDCLAFSSTSVTSTMRSSTSSPTKLTPPEGKDSRTKKSSSLVGPVLGGVFAAIAVLAVLLVVAAVIKFKPKKMRVEPCDVWTAGMTEPNVAPNQIKLGV